MKWRHAIGSLVTVSLLAGTWIPNTSGAQQSPRASRDSNDEAVKEASTLQPPEALDWAFKFASALDSDPKDKGQAQESVVMDYASLGSLDEAARRADRVEGWRRGAVYGELATLFAKSGRKDEARALVEKAESVKGSITGWQGPRISSHVAEALASLGDLDDTRRLTEGLATDDRQYAGRGAAIVAAALATNGDFEGAMRKLDEIKGDSDLDISWWRTAGYLQLARQSTVSTPQKRRALQAARRSADGVPGWMGAEALESIAEELRLSGEKKKAREALDAAEKILGNLGSNPLMCSLQSNLARAWARVGEPTRARALLTKAMVLVPQTQSIDQPAIYSNLAFSYRTVGDEVEATRLYDKAFVAAESLENARPRALAVVEICRSMARSGVPISDGTRSRLESLFGGLKEPW